MEPVHQDSRRHDSQPGSNHQGPIYLDNNATTPLHPAVSEAMEPFVWSVFGNPSSDHTYGVAARAAVVEARQRVAELLGSEPDEVVFTSGGSEADNLALRGAAGIWRERHGRAGTLLTSAVEHPAVTEAAAYLAQEGWRVEVLPVDSWGRVGPAVLEERLRPDTALVSVMHANNETGTVNPIAELAGVCRDRGVLFHTDAAQSVGKLPTKVGELGIDLLTVAAHKFHGPKGVGALYVRRGVDLQPLILGGGQEGGRRAGTENLLGIAGLGAAAALATSRGLGEFQGKVREARDRLEGLLLQGIPGAEVNGHPVERLPNTLNISFRGLYGRDLLAGASSVAASTGSACHEGEDLPSPVLSAMGVGPERALGAVRLSLGLLNGSEDPDRAANALVASARRLRT